MGKLKVIAIVFLVLVIIGGVVVINLNNSSNDLVGKVTYNENSLKNIDIGEKKGNVCLGGSFGCLNLSNVLK